MNRNSSEVLPGEYRQTRTIDFVNFSAENVIGLLLTLVLLVGPVLLVLPKHPFNLLFSAKKPAGSCPKEQEPTGSIFLLYLLFYIILRSHHLHPRGHASRLRPPRGIPDLLQGDCSFPE